MKDTNPTVTTETEATVAKRNRTTNIARVNEVIAKLKKQADKDGKISVSALEAFVREFSSNGKNALVTKVVNGVTVHQCNRLQEFFPIEAMVTTKTGKSLGYSKKSQEILNSANAFIRETIKIAVDGKAKEAVTKAKANFADAEKALIAVVMRSGVTPSDIASAKKAVTQAEKEQVIASELADKLLAEVEATPVITNLRKAIAEGTIYNKEFKMPTEAK